MITMQQSGLRSSTELFVAKRSGSEVMAGTSRNVTRVATR